MTAGEGIYLLSVGVCLFNTVYLCRLFLRQVVLVRVFGVMHGKAVHASCLWSSPRSGGEPATSMLGLWCTVLL